MGDDRDFKIVIKKLDTLQNSIDGVKKDNAEKHAANQREFGELKQQTTNLHQYVGAVSKNTHEVADDLADHAQRTETAHGIGASRSAVKDMVPWFALIVSVAVFLLLVFKVVKAG